MAKTSGGLRNIRPSNAIGNGDDGDKLQGRLVFPGSRGNLTIDEVARLIKIAGIPDNFTGDILVEPLNDNVISIKINDSGIIMSRTIYQDQKKIDNMYFKIRDKTKYKGYDIFAEQVRIAKKYGYKTIDVSAAGDSRSLRFNPDGFVGFYTWLRFGYVPDKRFDSINIRSFKDYVMNTFPEPTKKRLLKINSMTEFNKNPEALLWWLEIGGKDWSGTFDLSDNSYSMKQLKRYKTGKKKK